MVQVSLFSSLQGRVSDGRCLPQWHDVQFVRPVSGQAYSTCLGFWVIRLMQLQKTTE